MDLVLRADLPLLVLTSWDSGVLQTTPHRGVPAPGPSFPLEGPAGAAPSPGTLVQQAALGWSRAAPHKQLLAEANGRACVRNLNGAA